MQKNDLTITINIDYITLKLLQEGAAVMTSNFNRTHPKHGYVQSDKVFTWDMFLKDAIRNQYESELDLQKKLDTCS